MKVSREQMAENRQRILEVASRLFREKGFEAVSVAEVMKAAGLTHGGFYGHFDSKDDLIVHALGYAIDTRKGASLDLRAFLDEYLSPRHRDNAAGGCPIAGLAADTLRQPSEARSAVTDGVRAQIEWIYEKLAGLDEIDRRREAIGSCAAMVGAMILARATTDPAFSDEILKETRAWIDDGLNRPAAAIPEPA
ncbi:TetR/AcrR family transcriptional regulator [Sinorhizobium meliloti]|uniref:TetR/AcrR family transcriptional regulator n=1 Tax=Rhizobium meliloti TaxID=382 RepID=UPI003D6524B6